MLYCVYKTINKLNSKEYIGFHKIKSSASLVCLESDVGSIFSDGYLGSGKLMKFALEKYGPLNMKQELLFCSNNKKEVEEYEKSIVNEEWIKRDDTYNISIGGNVTILFGEQNGFYGKKHSKKSIEKLQESRNKTLATSKFSWCELLNTETSEVYFTYQDVFEAFGISRKSSIYKLVAEGKLKYKSMWLQEKAIDKYNSIQERRTNWKKSVSNRFKGIAKTPESNLKRGKSISNWISNNPELHSQRMKKINENPEKISKMVAKQIGTKWYYNPKTGEKTRINPTTSKIPEGWILGWPKK